jgi:hypothetical protein
LGRTSRYSVLVSGDNHEELTPKSGAAPFGFKGAGCIVSVTPRMTRPIQRIATARLAVPPNIKRNDDHACKDSKKGIPEMPPPNPGSSCLKITWPGTEQQFLGTESGYTPEAEAPTPRRNKAPNLRQGQQGHEDSLACWIRFGPREANHKKANTNGKSNPNQHEKLYYALHMNPFLILSGRQRPSILCQR